MKIVIEYIFFAILFVILMFFPGIFVIIKTIWYWDLNYYKDYVNNCADFTDTII
jgi:hypothetical protein